jgi:hypothetical protein
LVRSEAEQDVRDSNEARRGQICALIITLAAIGAGAYTALNGHEVAGSIIGVGGIGSIVTTFLAGRNAVQQEPELKNPKQSPKVNAKEKRRR